ncbi:hypothetical protein AWENTII_006901 [Aspergillus wentii]
MAIIGTLFLQLVAVASTGLLTLETDGVPQFITVAIGWKGLDYPVGTTAEHALQPFNVSSDIKTSTNSLITAEVDVFTPDLDCEVWEVVYHNLSCFNTPCNSKDVNLTISTKSCPGYLQTQIFASDTAGLSYLANVKHVSCSGTAADNKNDWLVFLVAHCNTSSSVDKQEVLACAPTYNITRQSVSITASGKAKTFHPISSNSAEMPPSPSPIDLSLGLLSSLETSRDPFWFFGHKELHMPGSEFDTFFTPANLTNPHSSQQWIIKVTVPALRGNLDCLPMVSQSLTFDPEDFIPDGDFAEGCERYGTIYTPENAHIGGYLGMYDSTQLKDETCSRVVLNFGYLLDDHSTDQIHSYACNATIDILDVNVTYSLPDHTITTADPIESSRQQFIPHYEPYEDNFMYMLPVRNDTSKGYDQF